MNKDFEIIDDKVIVHTDDRCTLTREVTNNVEDILICENNIEYMEEKLQYYLDKTKQSKKKISSKWSDLGLCILWFIPFVLNSVMGKWWLSILQFFCSASWGCRYFINVNDERKFIKASKPIIKELENNLIKEKEKLNELNKDKTNDLMYVETSKKEINRSEQIRNLKRKLDVIYSFEIHKTKIIRHYKRGILREMLAKYFYLNYYDDYDYALLEELIKNDLSKKEEKKTSKQKVLKRR